MPTSSWITPTAQETLLLRAGILEGQQALDAWYLWKAQSGPERLSLRETRLAPLVFRNLRGRLEHDVRLAPFERESARVWVANQIVMRTLREALHLLDQAGIDALVLKGAALLPLYYRDLGARWMADADILVPHQDFWRAYKALREREWLWSDRDPEFFDPRFRHSLGLTDVRGRGIDLHCHVLTTSCEPGADNDFWSGSVRAELAGEQTRTLCATDHLLHVCIHGQDWALLPSLRWYGDAAAILRGAEIDWGRLVAEAEARGVSRLVSRSFDALANTLDIKVPPALIKALNVAPVGSAERTWVRIISRERRGHPIRLLAFHWAKLSRASGQVGLLPRLKLIPVYLRCWFEVARWWHLPWRFTQKLGRLIVHRRRAPDRRRRALAPEGGTSFRRGEDGPSCL